MPNIVADSFAPEEGGKIVVATNAHLESKDATIDAKKIRFDYRTGTIVAEGNVVYATKNLRIIGDRARFGEELRRLIDRGEERTAHNTALNLNVALSYGARAEILAAARAVAAAVARGDLAPEEVN